MKQTTDQRLLLISAAPTNNDYAFSVAAKPVQSDSSPANKEARKQWLMPFGYQHILPLFQLAVLPFCAKAHYP